MPSRFALIQYLSSRVTVRGLLSENEFFCRLINHERYLEEMAPNMAGHYIAPVIFN